MQKVGACCVPQRLMEEHQKNCQKGTLNFLTQYEEDGNDLFGRITAGDRIWIHFYKPERKSVSMVPKKTAPRKFKNQLSAGHVMLTASSDCCGLLYTEFDPDAQRERSKMSPKTRLQYFTAFEECNTV